MKAGADDTLVSCAAGNHSAFEQEERFMLENESRLDANQRAYYVSIAANRWYGVCVALWASAPVMPL